MGVRGPLPMSPKVRALRGGSHSKAKPLPPAEPFEVEEGPAAIRDELKRRHRWRASSPALLASYASTCYAEERIARMLPAADDSEVVKLATKLERLAELKARTLRTLGWFDAHEIDAEEDPATSPARWMT